MNHSYAFYFLFPLRHARAHLSCVDERRGIQNMDSADPSIDSQILDFGKIRNFPPCFGVEKQGGKLRGIPLGLYSISCDTTAKTHELEMINESR